MIKNPTLMYDNTLSTSPDTLYTAPASPGYAIVEEIVVHNNSDIAVILTAMQIGNTRIWGNHSLAARETLSFHCNHVLAAGTAIMGQAGTDNTLQCSISGTEVIA